jgi:hypothetical protein
MIWLRIEYSDCLKSHLEEFLLLTHPHVHKLNTHTLTHTIQSWMMLDLISLLSTFKQQLALCDILTVF